VSTKEQGSDGVSLQAQEDKAMAYCAANDLDVCRAYHEAESGKRDKNRPEFQEAVKFAINRKAVLVVYSISRASRSVVDLYQLTQRLDKAGADFVSLTEHFDTTWAAGKMFFGIMAVLAQFERELIGERTKMALAHKKSKGERVGGIPYGFRAIEGSPLLVEDEEEQENIAYIKACRVEGMSLRRIQEDLMVCGVKSRSGNAKWRLESIANICRVQETPTE
jgi:site-specific DNA recombinase